MGIASAATPGSAGTSIVDKIATKFNLKKAEVQQVFDQDHAARQAEREVQKKTRLDQAVKDGKLTQDQEDKLIAKQKELETQRQANRNAIQSKTKAERQADMDTERTAFQKWIADNKIPEEYAQMGGPGGHHGRGPMHGN